MFGRNFIISYAERCPSPAGRLLAKTLEWRP
jgi:hypothetical protein